MNMYQLKVEIEQTRKKMCTLARDFPLVSKEVIEISNYLDKLIAQYQRFVS